VLGRDDILELAFMFTAANGIAGDYFEFGSFGGRTFRMAFEASRSIYRRNQVTPLPHLYAFDSFEGLPEPVGVDRDHGGWKRGDFTTSLDDFRRIAAAAGVPDDEYTTVAGFYHVSLTRELQASLGAVRAAVTYLDCDLYESTRDVLGFVLPFLEQGSIMCMDDWNCFRAARDRGQRLAAREWLADHPEVELEPWYPFGWHGQAFIVHRSIG